MTASSTAAATAARPVPGRWSRALHVAEVEARRYRRNWRGSVTSAFLNPLLYLGAMGLGLGSLVDRGAVRPASAGCPTPPSSRPG